MARNKDTQKTFSTLDISTAAFLELNGIPAKLENQNGRIIFLFRSATGFMSLHTPITQTSLYPWPIS